MSDFKPQVVRADSFDWVTKSIPDGSVDLIVTDPPYGKIIGAKWDQTWTYENQCHLAYLIARTLREGGTAYVFGGIGTYQNRIFFKWLSELEDSNYEQHGRLRIWDCIVWGKRRAYGTKNRYLFTREEVVMLIKGDKPKTFNVPHLEALRGYRGYNSDYPALSEHYRRSNVWTDVNELFKGKIHPTEKPSRLAEIMIETSSNPGDLVLDMFGGSGSTGVAAQKLGRRSIIIEKSDCKMRIE